MYYLNLKNNHHLLWRDLKPSYSMRALAQLPVDSYNRIWLSRNRCFNIFSLFWNDSRFVYSYAHPARLIQKYNLFQQKWLELKPSPLCYSRKTGGQRKNRKMGGGMKKKRVYRILSRWRYWTFIRLTRMFSRSTFDSYALWENGKRSVTISAYCIFLLLEQL